jgi:hypothetical protein
MMIAEGVVAARTLGEARSVIDKLELFNWVPTSPRKLVKGRVFPHVLVVGDFQITEPILRSIEVAAGDEPLRFARVDLV